MLPLAWERCLVKWVEIDTNIIYIFVAVCWSQDPHERPTFSKIIKTLEKIQNSNFIATEHESFRTMQNDWQTEINENFAELKEREKVGFCVGIFFMASTYRNWALRKKWRMYILTECIAVWNSFKKTEINVLRHLTSKRSLMKVKPY